MSEAMQYAASWMPYSCQVAVIDVAASSQGTGVVSDHDVDMAMN
jgi:hypothetical protein